VTHMSGTLGIVAGGGELPIAIAQTARDKGRAVFILALEGAARPSDVASFPHGFVSIGEVGKAIRLLKQAGCSDITLAGRVSRPDFGNLKLDTRGAMALPRVVAAALKGDDALLRALLGLFEKEGFTVIGSAEAARDLLAPAGPLGKLKPAKEDQSDILHALRVVRAMGALDIGQAAVVCRGLVLAVEAAEGTDAMMARIAELPGALRGTVKQRKGVLVKAAKPHQERRVDLPVIGLHTVELAKAAGLAGIAVESGAALIMNRTAVAANADRAGLFVYGFGSAEFSR